MISEVVMPQMGSDMTEGTIVRWMKKEGDAVERGEIIAEIETDKANVEIEAFESGVFRKVLAQEGDTVDVGTPIAVIASANEDISQYEAAPAAAKAKPAPATAAGTPAPTAAPPLSLPTYVGTYSHYAFGDLFVTFENGGLVLRFDGGQIGDLVSLGDHRFRVTWRGADHYRSIVTFAAGGEGPEQLTLQFPAATFTRKE